MKIIVRGKSYLPTENEILDDHNYFFYNIGSIGSLLLEQIDDQFSFSFIPSVFKTLVDFKHAYYTYTSIIISKYSSFEDTIEELNMSINQKTTTI